MASNEIMLLSTEVLAATSCAYRLATIAATERWRRQPIPRLDVSPGVTIIKPLCGADPELAENLRSFFQQNYPDFEVILGALDPTDESLEIARSVASEFPAVRSCILSGGPALGYNLKVSNIIQMAKGAHNDILVVSDSDMRVGPDYLVAVVAELTAPDVGLVTCPYRGQGESTIAAVWEAIGISTDFLPSAFLAKYAFGVSFGFGSTLAVRQSDVNAAGGWLYLANELADDYRLAEMISNTNKRVVLSHYVTDNVVGAEKLDNSIDRRLRWARTSRAMQPVPYLGTFISHTTVMGIFALANDPTWRGGAVLVTCLLVRLIAGYHASRTLGWRGFGLATSWLFVADIVTFCIWLASLFGTSIRWRGQRFHLRAGGKLEPYTNA